ncbi:MAG: 4Fe-4S dicluster domain-containing protein [Candidatus Njordarchaeia archaeon]
MGEIKHWKEYYEDMMENKPLVIYYPTCGGGEECITACPFKDKIWGVETMNVSLFGIFERPRKRPVMKNPQNCMGCYLCVEACPTGALKPREKPHKHPYLSLIYNLLKLPFKKRYNIKFVLRKEHVEKFLKNNSKEIMEECYIARDAN